MQNARRGPGKIGVFYEAQCGRKGCQETQISFAYSSRDAGVHLRTEGWRRTKADGWICPKCAKGQQ